MDLDSHESRTPHDGIRVFLRRKKALSQWHAMRKGHKRTHEKVGVYKPGPRFSNLEPKLLAP